MGNKGDKFTNDSAQSHAYLSNILAPIPGITSRKMFGGFGIFHEGKMFGIVDSKGKIFFKTNDESSAKYLKKGSKKHSRMPYYDVPEDILEEENLLIEWANESISLSK